MEVIEPLKERLDLVVSELRVLKERGTSEPINCAAPTVPDYGEVTLSYVKRKIREESVRKWQDRYDASLTGSVTRVFLPDVEKAYGISRRTKPTPLQVQALTGHRGIGTYLHRFQLREDPGCECDSEVDETVWHLLMDCPRFQSDRMDLEHRINKRVSKQNLAAIMEDGEAGTLLLGFAEKVFRIAAGRNKTENPADCRPLPGGAPTRTAPHPAPRRRIPQHQILTLAECGRPGLEFGPLELFMSDTYERLGIGFCR
ncbi:unnamed protein product [Arctia plantaginis]|uniref:Uncharacterized protein n=1 Tax=Arctia plantaginis TaxID=874455 RepID=A0A8S1B4A2_ARCPL|nr:unnamed protein product [Arctia plantaginis]